MLAVVALSARRLVGWAAADGLPVVAFDVFGDADTRALATEWFGIADCERRIHSGFFIGQWRARVDRGDLDGWVAGSGFEGRFDLMERAASFLPLRGTAPADQRRLADAPAFFADLDAHGIAHPPVAFDPPAGAGWLRKRTDSAGGWGIDRRRSAAPGVYWQREREGVPMSAGFVANGARAVVLGFNRQAHTEIGERPFVFEGVFGPVPVAERTRSDVESALAFLVPAYRLNGLGSLDFVPGPDGVPEVLEVNARPSASAALYPWLDGASPLTAHLLACTTGELPEVPAPTHVRGTRIVFARRPLRLGEAEAARIAATPGASDLPRPGTSFAAGEPVCTLDAEGTDADAVEAALGATAADLLHTLEMA